MGMSDEDASLPGRGAIGLSLHNETVNSDSGRGGNETGTEREFDKIIRFSYENNICSF